MCAIAGLISSRGAVSAAALRAMTDLMAHRGPDGEGHWLSADGRVGFGHRRLAIIDLSERGAQPMRRGGLTITFNGEIYNYVELKQRLQQEGVAFETDSDTEVILAAYERWGDAAVRELNGMFAFAIHDDPRNRLFCARDRFGEKPFLYTLRPGLVAFASEYRALLGLAEVRADWDAVALLRFLHRPSEGLDDAVQTVFTDIRQLPPACILSVACDTLEATITRYWDVAPDPALVSLSYADAVDRFRTLLTDSVRIRLRSDVPVGSCLSGGLDSGSIVCLSRHLLGDGPVYNAFTGRFPGTPADEGTYVAHAADRAAATGHTVEPTAAGFLADLPDFIWANELPVGSSSQYAQYCVFRLARETGVTVLLDGQGSDEGLGGYEQYFRDYLAALRALGRDPGHYAAEEAAIRVRYPAALETARQAFGERMPLKLRRAIAQATGKGSNVLYGLPHAYVSAVAQHNRIEPDLRFHPLAASLYRDSFRKFLSTLLRYGDRNSMAHAREVRLPFCDHRIPELALSLPPEHLMGATQTKRLLRDAMTDILPEEIRTRWNKQGFLPPQDLWFRDHLAEAAEAVIEEPGFATSGFWVVPWWRALVRRLKAGETHLAWVLWRPFIFDAWRRHFLDRIAAQPKVSAFAESSGP